MTNVRSYARTHHHSEYRMFAGTPRSRRRRRTTTRWLRWWRPWRRPLPDGPDRSTTRRRCGSQERCELAPVMSRMVQVRTYGMHGFVAVGDAQMYTRATVPTEHRYLSHAFALCSFVRISVVRRLVRTWPVGPDLGPNAFQKRAKQGLTR